MILMSKNKLNKNFAQLKTTLELLTTKFQVQTNSTLYDNIISNSGIYCFTYLPDPRYVYLGQAENFQIRYKQHCYDLEHGIHCGKFGIFYKEHNCSIEDFKFDILKYIPNNNPILKNIYEREYIRQYAEDGFHILLNSIIYKEK